MLGKSNVMHLFDYADSNFTKPDKKYANSLFQQDRSRLNLKTHPAKKNVKESPADHHATAAVK